MRICTGGSFKSRPFSFHHLKIAAEKRKMRLIENGEGKWAKLLKQPKNTVAGYSNCLTKLRAKKVMEGSKVILTFRNGKIETQILPPTAVKLTKSRICCASASQKRNLNSKKI
jgi:transposase-like protein